MIVQMTQSVEIDDSGEITSLVVHDAKLIGLLLAQPKRLLIAIQVGSGETTCLVLNGVDRLRADDFRQGNIILSASVSSGSNVEKADVAYAHGLSENDVTFLESILPRIEREQLLVVRLDPSYGCALVCICSAIEVCASLTRAITE